MSSYSSLNYQDATTVHICNKATIHLDYPRYCKPETLARGAFIPLIPGGPKVPSTYILGLANRNVASIHDIPLNPSAIAAHSALHISTKLYLLSGPKHTGSERDNQIRMG